MSEQGSLFEVEDAYVPKSGTVDYLAGFFAQKFMGDQKPGKRELEMIEGIARDALVRAEAAIRPMRKVG